MVFWVISWMKMIANGSLLQLDWMIDHYEKKMDYEKCAYIRDVKKRNFYVAPPIMQGILNDQMALSLGKENEQR